MPSSAEPTSGSPALPHSWLPAAVAGAFFLVFCLLVLNQSEKLIEPDAYAYRASIEALKNGQISLNQTQYDALSLQLQQSSLGGGIMQWHRNDDGSWVSEKNPGYPFLAVPFDAIGARRLAPLFYGLLACLGMWFGGRRWLGRWGGTFAIGVYCATPLAMVMAWRSTMPSFTDASLIAAGLGLLIWSIVAIERGATHRRLVGALAFFTFSTATFVRYTNVVVVLVAAVIAVAVIARPRWGLSPTTLFWWFAATLPPFAAVLIYNTKVFDGPFSTGYRASTIQFTVGAIPENLRIMPRSLLQAMPVVILALAALIGLLASQIMAVRRQQGSTEPRARDRVVGSLLVLTWISLWGLYSAYEWTATFTTGPGNLRPGAGPSVAMSGTQTVYSTVRFYLPALGAIALLAAWLLTRIPPMVSITVLVGLFAIGGREYIATTTSRWAGQPSVGGPSRPEMQPPDRPSSPPPAGALSRRFEIPAQSP